jgi:ribosomal protein L31
LPRLRRNLNSRSKGKTKVERKVKIRPMDPIEMCGKDTSVTQLYRVEETADKGRIHHLVFFDKHGWYCEHGKQCSAVGDVQKFTRKKF